MNKQIRGWHVTESQVETELQKHKWKESQFIYPGVVQVLFFPVLEDGFTFVNFLIAKS